MILDSLANAARYTTLNPVFNEVFEFLASDEPAALGAGFHDMGRFRVVAIHTLGNGHAGIAIERHLRDIDIHFTIEGVDIIGWRAVNRLTAPRGAFDPVNDCQLFDDEPDIWVPQPPGVFSIQFPGDGHAPLGNEGEIRKIVVKIGDV